MRWISPADLRTMEMLHTTLGWFIVVTFFSVGFLCLYWTYQVFIRRNSGSVAWQMLEYSVAPAYVVIGGILLPILAVHVLLNL
jgi:hypothetical protein